MKKKNRGFTLIELLIAIAVLSIMAAVLFQVFAVSRKLGQKSRKSEVVQNIAKKTMEELKGYSFETLNRSTERETDEMLGEMLGELSGKMSGEMSDEMPGTVKIAGTTYSYEPLPKTKMDGERNGYLLKTAYGNETDSGRVKYLIEAKVDSGIYRDTSDEAKDKAYSINLYRMPNIADVSSYQNIVLEPQMIAKDKTDTVMGDSLRVAQLLEKVNPEEEEAKTEDTELYEEGDIKKYLDLKLIEKSDKKSDKKSGRETAEEEDSGQLLAEASVIYTVDSAKAASADYIDPVYSLTFPLASFNKKVEKEEKTGNPMNRIYLFLPKTENAEFEKIFITTETESLFELYVMAADGYELETADHYIFINTDGGKSDKIDLYTNLKGDHQLVSSYPEKDRLYHLTVTVYEADYSTGTIEPKIGEKLLELDSSKSE